MINAARPSQILIPLYQTTRRHIPKKGSLLQVRPPLGTEKLQVHCDDSGPNTYFPATNDIPLCGKSDSHGGH